MVSKQVGKLTSGTRVPRGIAFTMGVYSERCASEAKDYAPPFPTPNPFAS